MFSREHFEIACVLMEERIRVVKLYIKPGKRATASLRSLRYPTNDVLKNRYREYIQFLDLPVDSIRLKPKCSPQQIMSADERYLSHGQCLAFR